MPYTLGCCFFGTPNYTEADLPVHTTALEPNPYRTPTPPASYREVDLPVHTRTLEPNPYRKTFKASATLAEVPVAVWVGLAAVAGLSLLLTYRLRGRS